MSRVDAILCECVCVYVMCVLLREYVCVSMKEFIFFMFLACHPKKCNRIWCVCVCPHFCCISLWLATSSRSLELSDSFFNCKSVSDLL